MTEFDAVADRLVQVADAVGKTPVFQWGTVVQSSPLRVALDGATSAMLPITPATLVPILVPGERVITVKQHGQLTILAAANRKRGMPEGTTTQMNALSLYAVEGMRFFNLDDEREYVYVSGQWVDPRFTPHQGQVPSSVVVGSGSATVAADGTVTFTNASTVSLNGVFDGLGADTYDITLYVEATGPGGIVTRMRANNADYNGSTYNHVGQYTAHDLGPTRFAQFGINYFGTWYPNPIAYAPVVGGRMTMFNPMKPSTTNYEMSSYTLTSDRILTNNGGDVGGQHDGFTVFSLSSVGLLGTIKVVKIA